MLPLRPFSQFSLPKQFPGDRQDVRESRIRKDAGALIQDRHRDVEQLLDSHPQELEDGGRLGGRPLAAAGLLLGLGLGVRGLGSLLLLGVVVAVPPPRQSGRGDILRRVVLHHEVDAAAAAAATAATALELVAGGTVPGARPRTALVPVLFRGFSITLTFTAFYSIRKGGNNYLLYLNY